MKNVWKNIKKWVVNNTEWLVLAATAVVCTSFIVAGNPTEEGYITLNGKPAEITEATKDWIEDANEALARIMNHDVPTDQTTIEENDEPMGQGFTVDIETILSRIEPDGDTDNGRGWQCSKYTAYLATGKREYSSSHTDYGPVNGKDVAAYLVKNYGFKYIDQPVKGAIGSGGFNTTYGHTAVYLYSTGTNTAMVNDANWKPLAVGTHNMNISGWVWVVPGDYIPTPTPTPTPEPTPTPTPSPVDPEPVSGTKTTYTYVPGDYFSKVLVKIRYDEGDLWSENGSVKYYTQQLINQDMLDSRGNVKLNIPFTLVKR